MKTLYHFAIASVLLSLVACGRDQARTGPDATPPMAEGTTIVDSRTAITGGNITINSQTVINAQTSLVQPAEVSTTASASASALVVSEATLSAVPVEASETAVVQAQSLPSELKTAAAPPSDSTGAVRLFARAGSKMRIEGTSNIHDWQVESGLIGGSVEVGRSFPLDPTLKEAPGDVRVSGEVFVTARSLKSMKADGTPYSDIMDNIMHTKLLAQEHPRLTFRVTELNLSRSPEPGRAAFGGVAAGELKVAGVTRALSFPVEVLPLGEGKARISGSMNLKLTEFSIEPPVPAGMLIKTGDGVKVLFDWNVAVRTPSTKS